MWHRCLDDFAPCTGLAVTDDDAAADGSAAAADGAVWFPVGGAGDISYVGSVALAWEHGAYAVALAVAFRATRSALYPLHTSPLGAHC